MELRVHKVQQAASAGSHVTIYQADVELVLGDVRVEILGVEPNDTVPSAVEAAREAIRRGAVQVLQPRGLGAVIRVERIVIDPVDFKARQFERCTAEELARLVADNA